MFGNDLSLSNTQSSIGRINARNIRILAFIPLLSVVMPLATLQTLQGITSRSVQGIVYEDLNGNGKRGRGEPGIPGVMVSNQREVVLTDPAGYYTLPVRDEMVIFLTKPAGYATPLDQYNRPQFYYIHQPNGSPELDFPGIEPTGRLPRSLDFPLVPAIAQDTFQVLAFADPQVGHPEEVEYLATDVVAELGTSDAAFCITLGDIVFDQLDLFEPYSAVMGRLGIPIYNVPGNHDSNYRAASDQHSSETFKRHFGPNYYSFDYGEVHFIALDDINYLGYDESSSSRYEGRIGEQQLEWLANDLELVPLEKLIVLTMHIPLFQSLWESPRGQVLDREQLFQILSNRTHLLALAGHDHTIEHYFLDDTQGWTGEVPLHLIACAAASGAWWGGPLDERGVPDAIQTDGSPNGYHIFTFEGNTYQERFKAASMAADFQLRIVSPNDTLSASALDTTKIVVNVFDGNERSAVSCTVDGSVEIDLQRTQMIDPYVRHILSTQRDHFYDWVSPSQSLHIWTAPLPTGLTSGQHSLMVHTLNMFGRSYSATQVFTVK